MDIGTAKPGAAERARVPHHLIDLVDPDERYSAGQFRTTRSASSSRSLQGKSIPCLVGGTMLYYRSLVAGLDALPPATRGQGSDQRRGSKARLARAAWRAREDRSRSGGAHHAERLRSVFSVRSR
jgi:tRNA dimethylallyltransferase